MFQGLLLLARMGLCRFLYSFARDFARVWQRVRGLRLRVCDGLWLMVWGYRGFSPPDWANLGRYIKREPPLTPQQVWLTAFRSYGPWAIGAPIVAISARCSVLSRLVSTSFAYACRVVLRNWQPYVSLSSLWPFDRTPAPPSGTQSCQDMLSPA